MIGPILGCELRVVARRAKSYRQRSSLAIALLLAVGISLYAVQRATGGRLSVQETALFAQYVFSAVLTIQVTLTIGLVPALVAGAIAQERERRTLDSLLATRLTSAEIVLGKLFGGLVQYAACLLTTLPIMIVLSLLGGIDPRLVLMTHAGTAAIAFFVGGLSILVSTSERRAGRALNLSIGLAMAWFILPVVLQFLLPRVSPLLWSWVREYNAWFLASSPIDVADGLMRFGIGPRFIDSIMWMIGLQFTCGCAFVIWSIVRLRRSSRRQADGEGARNRFAQLWTGLRRRLFRRPPCGEDPVLWKEIHTSRVPRLAEILAALCALLFVGLIGYGTCYFGWPALIEVYTQGFGTPGPDPNRTVFNQFLGLVSSWVEFFLLLIVAGVASGSVTVERASDTWESLIATPLGGREILRAKMIGVVWKVRLGVAVLVVLWGLGLMSGSLHPVGFVAAVVVLGASIWFMTALGTLGSLHSRDSASASNRSLIPALLLSGSFLIWYVPSRYSSVFMGAGSPPVVNWLCLVSNGDVRDVMGGSPTFRRFEQMNVYTYESPLRVLAACLCSIAVFSTAALLLSRVAFNRFDRVAGRPERVNTQINGPAIAPSRSWRGRRAVVTVVLVIIVLGITMVVWLERGERPLRDALAETDRLFPAWRLDDLEAARQRVPDQKNSAVLVSAAAELLPPSWRSAGTGPSQGEQNQLEFMASVSPEQQLSLARLRSLRAAVEQAGPALAEARGLADLRDGRFPVAWSRDGISTRLPHLAMIREVAHLLLVEAILESEAGKADQSLATCRAILNAGRSIGDEPALVSQAGRMKVRETVCRQVERALAHGQASDSAIESMRRSLDEEEGEPLLVFGIRGERAFLDRFLCAVDAGDFTQRQLRTSGFDFSDEVLWTNAELRAALLRLDNRAERIASLPAEEQLGAFERLSDDGRSLSPSARKFVPAIVRIALSCLNSRARLRCASAGLACERYRLARGVWPTSYEDLVPAFIPRVPIDPFDGKPPRFCRVKDQLVIYSVGVDRRDDGGQTEAVGRWSAGKDVEFRLWDPSSRHQGSAPRSVKNR
jgi:ABC-type transport system involved in multi-copper enzyme maturation permease subunit